MMEFSVLDKTPYKEDQMQYLDALLGQIVFPWHPFSQDNVEIVQHDGNWKISSLLIDGNCYMTNSAPDLLDHRKIFEEAEGDILLTGYGLGLGVILADLNLKVNTITVVENNQTIIDVICPMVDSVCKRIKANVLYLDANTWIPEQIYDFAFIDHDYQRADSERYTPFCKKLVSWWDERQELEKSWR